MELPNTSDGILNEMHELLDKVEGEKRDFNQDEQRRWDLLQEAFRELYRKKNEAKEHKTKQPKYIVNFYYRGQDKTRWYTGCRIYEIEDITIEKVNALLQKESGLADWEYELNYQIKDIYKV